MNFLNNKLKGLENEKPVIILVEGFPADDTVIPNIQRKSLDEIAVFFLTNY